MRFALDALQNNEGMFGKVGNYLNDTEVIPTTKGLKYPQDQRPAGTFGPNGVDPTVLPQMRDNYMRSPGGGISSLENVLGIVAANDTSNWPSILKPVPKVPAEYRYDEHMKEYVPNLPRRV